ncbi:hypothetical protein N7V09_00040 [Shewanella seohaensis]|uniref:hypothetical protein n=1 Tax=Shewanella seohaensis TaxID=755175 RepID=UPI0021C7F738|nr:hypothetical protein [Shewanella seohaensis]UXM82148.1 hypothetical protein N7V09_00040 [Shewanella seohaensis]
MLAAAYPNYIQIVANKESGIKTSADLKGKTVSRSVSSGTESTRAPFSRGYDGQVVEFTLCRIGRMD